MGVKTRRGSPVDPKHSTNEAPPTGKIHPFNKITVTLESVYKLYALQELKPPKNCNIVHFLPLGVATPSRYFFAKDYLMNE